MPPCPMPPCLHAPMPPCLHAPMPQCASSQFSPVFISTSIGTLIGMAFTIISRMIGFTISSSDRCTSKTNSSWTWRIILHFRFKAVEFIINPDHGDLDHVSGRTLDRGVYGITFCKTPHDGISGIDITKVAAPPLMVSTYPCSLAKTIVLSMYCFIPGYCLK